jgi:cytosine deaminase
MTKSTTVFTNARLAEGVLRDIHVESGRISAIEAAGSVTPSAEVIDIGGELLVPGFVEGHIHFGYELLRR